MNKMPTKPVVLTLLEAARFLRVKKAVLQKLADQGQVPGRKVGEEWRFLQSSLENWLGGQSSSYQAMIEQVGIFKEDPDLIPMLEEIYKARGRPLVADEEE